LDVTHLDFIVLYFVFIFVRSMKENQSLVGHNELVFTFNCCSLIYVDLELDAVTRCELNWLLAFLSVNDWHPSFHCHHLWFSAAFGHLHLSLLIHVPSS